MVVQEVDLVHVQQAAMSTREQAGLEDGHAVAECTLQM